MKAIHVRYKGPTNCRGARMIATADGWGRVAVSYDYGMDGDGRAFKAACALMDKAFTYHGNRAHTLVSGGMPDGSTVFVFADGGPFVWHPKNAVPVSA